MNKAEKKFRLYAIGVIFVLLTVLLAVISGVNFTMAAEDADEITQMLADRQGSFDHAEIAPGGMTAQPWDREFRMGPMGPDSPETNASLRYFTIAFSKRGDKAETVVFRLSAVTEAEAQEWASGLVKETTGWTRGTYRYRVYEKDDQTYVTVIDQGRELLPSYRILIISAIGEALCLLIAWFVLRWIGRKLYAPIEEADRKQRNFIQNANRQFRLPLTVIGANTELAERKYGPDDETRSTRRQLAKLGELVDQLGTAGVYDEGEAHPAELPLSEFLCAALDREQQAFASCGVELTREIEPGVTLNADPEAIKKMLDELICNAQKFALTKARFALRNEKSGVLLLAENDAKLPDGPADQVFDRFAVLENAKNPEAGAGLGLAQVKQIVKAHNGRATAAVSGGIFTLRIIL